MYERFFKRIVDIICAALAIVVFSWLYIIVAVLVRIKLGGPVIFKQKRPGKDEKIFTLYKFRTMTDERGEDGELLSDDIRLTKFGKFLRSTSLDELPEAFNILFGDMSVIGPRPQLIRDMVFMTKEQRRRHSVRPGLSGLAQIKGRNGITWEEKLDYDLQYIDDGITFIGDAKIVFMTVWTAFVKKDGISQAGMDTAEDLGDYLLHSRKITQADYNMGMQISREL